MRWISFVILLLFVTVLQASVAPFVAVHTIRPDLMIILAVHYALAARGSDAVLAAYFIGLAIDLTSLGFAGDANVGLHALAFGLIATAIVKLRDLTFRESVVTQFLFTFAAKLLLSLMIGVYLLYVLKLEFGWREIITVGAYTAAYTAVLAPYGYWFLRGLRRPLGIGTTHRLRVR
jgi:rod shape-determining protein MreD